MEAPLSSPSLHGPSQTQPSYFNSSTTSKSTSSLSSAQSSAPSSTARIQAPTHHQQQSQPQPQQSQQRQGLADTTSPFLRDFNLVAEAAKRAQMAVLMRDMEAVGI